jgi:hypothetical protein
MASPKSVRGFTLSVTAGALIWAFGLATIF